MTDVRPATQDDRELVARIAAESFHDDPLMSWILPDPGRRLEQLVFVFSGLVDDMLQDHGVIHVVDGASTALWRDPEYDHGRTTADRLQEAAAATAFAEGPFEPAELERFAALG